MTNYQQLSSQKYYQEAVRQEIKELRREKNRQAVRAFGQFLFALVVFLFTVSAVHQMPVWLPMVTEFLEQNGITERFQSWFSQLR